MIAKLKCWWHGHNWLPTRYVVEGRLELFYWCARCEKQIDHHTYATRYREELP
jgi:hypothetical protein